MRELAPESKRDSFLRRPLSSWVRLDGWMLVALAIVLVAAITRLWDLGARSYNHDEAIHAWESWKLYTGQGYIHNPTYHGPFLYHITALMYFLFGTSDYTGRLAPALFSIASVIAIFYLRPWLGRRGSLVAAALAVISPALLYYGRFIRHDVFSVFFTLLMFLGILNYLKTRRDWYLYLLVLGMALYFSNMETAFIQTFAFWSFLALFFVVQLVRNPGKSWREFPTFDLLMVMGTLVLPLTSPLAIKAVGAILKDPAFDPVQYAPANIIRSGIIWGIFMVASVVVGLWWDRKRWLTAAGIFYAIYIVLFTTFFTNGQGFATGQVGSLGYWLSQQGVRRGGQPWFYYLILMPLYEYLPLIFGIIGGAFFLFRRRGAHNAEDALPATGEPSPTGMDYGVPFVPMVMWWAVVNFIVFSWGGEKMPWLLTHLTLPFIVLTGWFADYLFNVDWRAAFQRDRAWTVVLMPMIVVALVGALSTHPFRGTSTADLNSTMAWMGSFALLLIAGVPFVRLGSDLGWRKTGHIAMVLVFAFLTIFTIHNSWMAVYQNGDVAVETLIYAQGTPDEPQVMKELETMSRRLTGGEKDLKVAYDDESSWPFVWYFRDWPNAQFYGKTPSGPLDADVVIVGPDNEAGVKPFLGNNYYRREYRLIWWPLEDYKSLTPAKVWQEITTPQGLQSLWNIIMYRKYDAPLAQWPLVNKFIMYVRKDVAAQMWDYGPETLTATSDQAQAPADDYITHYQNLTARQAWGTAGTAPNQLQEPKGVAIDAQGRIYVADSGNNRIEVLDANGAPVATWGSQGTGPGQFQEPWGVAVAPDGTVYVADTWNHRIEKFDSQGKFLAQWGAYGTTDGRAQSPDNILWGPRGVAVDSQGNVWVTDTGNKRVIKYDPNGKVLGQYGGIGAGDGQFMEPVGIAIDGQGNIYVADTWNHRVQVFDSNFTFLRQWPVEGWDSQSVVNKPYIAVDGSGNVYVTDPEAYRVIKYSPDGKVLAVWGKHGTDLGSFDLPTGIAVDTVGRVLVGDSANSRVMAFDPVP